MLQTGAEDILLGYKTNYKNMLGYETIFVKIVVV